MMGSKGDFYLLWGWETKALVPVNPFESKAEGVSLSFQTVPLGIWLSSSWLVHSAHLLAFTSSLQISTLATTNGST